MSVNQLVGSIVEQVGDDQKQKFKEKFVTMREDGSEVKIDGTSNRNNTIDFLVDILANKSTKKEREEALKALVAGQEGAVDLSELPESNPLRTRVPVMLVFRDKVSRVTTPRLPGRKPSGSR